MLTETEVLYWGEIPVGATVITALARRAQGHLMVEAMIKNPASMEVDSQTIPLDQVPDGDEVYLARPAGPGTLIRDLPLTKAVWGPETRAAIAAEVTRLSAEEPVRGVVPTRLEPSEIHPGENDFPVNCHVVICRKPRNVKVYAEFLIWRFWQTPEYERRRTLIPMADYSPGGPVYVRTDYLEADEPLRDDPFTGHTFMPVDWTQQIVDDLDTDMRLRTELRRIDKASDTFDIATYHANQVAMGIQGAIMLIDSDKRGAKQWGWAAFVAWCLHASKQKAHGIDVIRAERMR